MPLLSCFHLKRVNLAVDENSLEVVTAIRATIVASALCWKIRRELLNKESILKEDRSPVTVADLGSQAVICKLIRESFPGDMIAAEEDATELRKPVHSKVLDQVTYYVNEFIRGTSAVDVCSWIDLSSHSVGNRFWTLDPIDGTKGFLRGDQYAIALALVENGLVTLGLLACPNLYFDKDDPRGKRGCIFFALRGKGSFQLDMDGGHKRPLSVSRVENPSEAFFTESVEEDHADQLFHRRLARKLNISKPPLRMDSQAKYGIVARGEVPLYLRAPSPSEPGYREKIWDHAAGRSLLKRRVER